jgi:hypothetical protein
VIIGCVDLCANPPESTDHASTVRTPTIEHVDNDNPKTISRKEEIA